MNVCITVVSNILSEYFQKYKCADERKRGGVSTNFKKLKTKTKNTLFQHFLFSNKQFKQTINSIKQMDYSTLSLSYINKLFKNADTISPSLIEYLYKYEQLFLNAFKYNWFEKVCFSSNVELAKYMYSKLKIDLKQYIDKKHTKGSAIYFTILNKLCESKNCNVEMLEWLIAEISNCCNGKKICVTDFDISNIDILCKFGIVDGSETISKLTYETSNALSMRIFDYCDENEIAKNATHIFVNAISPRNYEMIERMLTMYARKIKFEHWQFIQACYHDDVKFLEWFYNIVQAHGFTYNLSGNEEWNSDGVQHAFYGGIRHGQFNIAKWIYNKSVEIGNPFDIHAHRDYATVFFCVKCGKKSIDAFEWLLKLAEENGKPLNVRIDDDRLFRDACNHFGTSMDFAFYLAKKYSKIYTIVGPRKSEIYGDTSMMFNIKTPNGRVLKYNRYDAGML